MLDLYLHTSSESPTSLMPAATSHSRVPFEICVFANTGLLSLRLSRARAHASLPPSHARQSPSELDEPSSPSFSRSVAHRFKRPRRMPASFCSRQTMREIWIRARSPSIIYTAVRRWYWESIPRKFSYVDAVFDSRQTRLPVRDAMNGQPGENDKQTNPGRSYWDYISHFHLHSRRS